MRDLVLEARYLVEADMVGATVTTGALSVSDGIALLFKHWGVPDPELAKKYGSDSGGPGDHGIPEIGQLEAAFYRTLTGGQKEAFADLKSLVTTLYERGMTWDGIDPFDVGESIDDWKMKAIAELAAHPMQAFLLGQYLATESASGKTMKPLSTEDKRTIGFLEHYTFDEIHSSFDNLKGDIRHALIEGMQQRAGPIAIARTLENTLNDHQTHWELLAITETARAESQGRLQEFLDRGYTNVRGSAAHDSRVCEWCRDHIDGQVVPIKDVIGLSNYGRKKDAWIQVIPAHPRCRCVWLPVWDKIIPISELLKRV
jgi:SPP1 gp7 family putative phage head morphogenesis protein